MISHIRSIGFLLLVFSCSSGAKKPGDAPVAVGAQNGTGCPTPVQTPVFQPTGTNTTAGGTNGVFLSTNVTYHKDIRPIMVSATCSSSSCHSSSSITKLDSYESIKESLYEITRVVEKTLSEEKHSSMNLSSAQKALFDGWKEAYAEGTAGSASTSSNTSVSTTPNGGSTSPTVDPCATSGSGTITSGGGVTSGTDTTVSDDYSDLISPAKKAECNNANKMYNRSSGGSCIEGSTREMSWCGDINAISAKFEEKARSGTEIKKAMTAKQSEGYVIDECGTEDKGSKAVVSMYKLDKTAETITQQIFRTK